jgi:hypothetical protein
MIRNLLKISFITLILASIVLVVIAILNKQWETTTAAISLLIAVVSSWIAYETFYTQSLAKKPQLILAPDFKSRYDLIQLSLKNNGEKSAYHIKILWNETLLNHKNAPVTFNKFSNKYEVLVLNPMEETKVIIDTNSGFFSRSKPAKLNYSGTITYKEFLDSKKLLAQKFEISFEHYGESPTYEDEMTRALYEIQQIPEKLETIGKHLKNIKIQINDSKQDLESKQ